MTEANQKLIYEHFVATQQKEKAEAILKVYPQFKDNSGEKVEEVKPKKVK